MGRFNETVPSHKRFHLCLVCRIHSVGRRAPLCARYPAELSGEQKLTSVPGKPRSRRVSAGTQSRSVSVISDNTGIESHSGEMLPNQGRPKKPLCSSTVTVFPTTTRSNTLLTTLKFSTFLPGRHEETVRLYWVGPFALLTTAFPRSRSAAFAKSSPFVAPREEGR